jgi:hypothetical protein
MTRGKRLIGFINRVAYAMLVSGFVWYLTLVPFTMTPLGRGAHLVFVKVLDFPVAMVSSVLPWQLKGIDPFSSERQPERANMWELLHAHVRVAVPVYVTLFYVPNAIAFFLGRRLRKPQPSQTSIQDRSVVNRS